jgi:hypothetical protein
MTTYTYTGKQPHVSTIRTGEAGKKVTTDLMLISGKDYSLDETHSIVTSLVRKGLLVEKKQAASTSSSKI